MKATLDQAKGNSEDDPSNDAQETKLHGFTHLNALLAETVDRCQTLYDRQSLTEITGISTGFPRIDQLTLGLHPGELVLVAGQPSVGKTAFALNLVTNVASMTKLPVGMFSLGLEGEQLTSRLIAATAGMSYLSLRTGQLTDQEWSKMSFALGKLHELPIFINEFAGLTTITVQVVAKELYRQNGQLSCLVVDSIDRIKVTGPEQNRKEEYSRILKRLKGVATQLNVPVIICYQLKAEVENRPKKHPTLSDLVESGIDTELIDSVFILCRNDIRVPGKRLTTGRAECVVAKQRNGPTGSVILTFRQDSLSFQAASIATVPAAAHH